VITIEKLREMIGFLQASEKNPGSLQSVLQGLESVYEGKGIPALPAVSIESAALSPSPAA
jgi:hypothetical protein